jgi:hypothetical protein
MFDQRASGVSRTRALALAFFGVAALTGCDVLSTAIENPNVVVQEDVEKPAAAAALVSGVLRQTAEAMGQMAAAHSTVSDELTWRGSFDVIGAFDRGELQHNDNLYSTAGYTALAVGRWLGDEAVRILEEHRANGDLNNLTLVAEAYWLAGVNRVLAAENFEGFAISDRQDAGGIVDRGTLFDTGIEDFREAASLAQQAGNTDLETAAMAYEARAHWSRALWQKLSPKTTPANPLLDVAAANTLATQVLARVSADWEHAFGYSSSTLQSRIGFEVNSRREVAIEDHIIEQDASLRQSCWPGNSDCSTDGIRLMDPIDDIQDPALRREAWGFMSSFIYPDNVGVSARELHLILAEAALANDDMTTFATHINAVRGLESTLTPYDPVVHAALDAEGLLIHMRRVNLFLQLQRRLLDMYRFDIDAPVWLAGQLALTAPGTVFPIGDLECKSNPEVPPC